MWQEDPDVNHLSRDIVHMRSGGVIHPEIASVMASLGHGDLVCIADAGLPIPKGVDRIDLAYRYGQPEFLDVVTHVAADLVIERWLVAEEATTVSPAIFGRLEEILPGMPQLLAHEDFKARTSSARVVIRTGESTPYANVLLQSGVPFG